MSNGVNSETNSLNSDTQGDESLRRRNSLGTIHISRNHFCEGDSQKLALFCLISVQKIVLWVKGG